MNGISDEGTIMTTATNGYSLKDWIYRNNKCVMYSDFISMNAVRRNSMLVSRISYATDSSTSSVKDFYVYFKNNKHILQVRSRCYTTESNSTAWHNWRGSWWMSRSNPHRMRSLESTCPAPWAPPNPTTRNRSYRMLVGRSTNLAPYWPTSPPATLYAVSSPGSFSPHPSSTVSIMHHTKEIPCPDPSMRWSFAKCWPPSNDHQSRTSSGTTKRMNIHLYQPNVMMG